MRSRANLLIGLSLVWLSLGASHVLAQPPQPTEYQIKAAFLFNFAKFVEWPPSAFSTDKAPITLCIAGGDPFGNTLDALISDKRIDNRNIAARRTKSVGDIASPTRCCALARCATRSKQKLSGSK